MLNSTSVVVATAATSTEPNTSGSHQTSSMVPVVTDVHATAAPSTEPNTLASEQMSSMVPVGTDMHATTDTVQA